MRQSDLHSSQQNRALHGTARWCACRRIRMRDASGLWIATSRVHVLERFTTTEGEGLWIFAKQLWCRNFAKRLSRRAIRERAQNRLAQHPCAGASARRRPPRPCATPHPPVANPWFECTPIEFFQGLTRTAARRQRVLRRRGSNAWKALLSCQYADRTLAGAVRYDPIPVRRGR